MASKSNESDFATLITSWRSHRHGAAVIPILHLDRVVIGAAALLSAFLLRELTGVDLSANWLFALSVVCGTPLIFFLAHLTLPSPTPGVRGLIDVLIFNLSLVGIPWIFAFVTGKEAQPVVHNVFEALSLQYAGMVLAIALRVIGNGVREAKFPGGAVFVFLAFLIYPVFVYEDYIMRDAGVDGVLVRLVAALLVAGPVAWALLKDPVKK